MLHFEVILRHEENTQENIILAIMCIFQISSDWLFKEC